MVGILDQVGSIVGGDLSSNIGIARQIGNAIFRNGYQINGLEIDSVIEESHESTVTATTQPVEYGFDPTDHVYADSDTVTALCIVSDVKPSDFYDFGTTGLVSEFTKGLTGDEQSRSQLTWAKLVQMQKAGEVFDLVTNLKTYTDMIIVGLSTSQTKDTAREIKFSISFRERKIVQSKIFTDNLYGTLSVDNPRTDVAKANQSMEDSLKDQTNDGKKAGILSDDDSPSLSRKIYDNLFG